jgi:hypothetical protein
MIFPWLRLVFSLPAPAEIAGVVKLNNLAYTFKKLVSNLTAAQCRLVKA